MFRRKYNLEKLINFQILSPALVSNSREQIICDIDKTYLETNFETLRQLAKIPFERPRDKITALGAREFLLALRWGNIKGDYLAEDDAMLPRDLHFVSSSPPQLREILRKKFFLDGLDWSTDTFKNQTYNIFTGRFDLLSHQTAYKSLAILQLMERAVTDTKFFLIGDSAEMDAYIYLGIKCFLEKKLSYQGYIEYLEIGKVESQIAELVLDHVEIKKASIDRIFIRCLDKTPLKILSPLCDPIIPFKNYLDLTLFLVENKTIEASALEFVFEDYFKGIRPEEGVLENKSSINPVSLDAYNRLSENEILILAKKWVQLK